MSPGILSIKGFKEHVQSLEIINDEDEDDERDVTSVNEDTNVLISHDNLS